MAIYMRLFFLWRFQFDVDTGNSKRNANERQNFNICKNDSEKQLWNWKQIKEWTVISTNKLPDVFISYASDILADTTKGLNRAELVKWYIANDRLNESITIYQEKMMNTKTEENTFTKKIGQTVYIVRYHFNEDAKEIMQEKNQPGVGYRSKSTV